MGALRQMTDGCVSNVQVNWTLPDGVTAKMSDVPSYFSVGRPWLTFVELEGKVR